MTALTFRGTVWTAEDDEDPLPLTGEQLARIFLSPDGRRLTVVDIEGADDIIDDLLELARGQSRHGWLRVR